MIQEIQSYSKSEGYIVINGVKHKAKAIDFDNITPEEHYAMGKMRMNGTHKEAASQEAMVEGVYKIFSIDIQKPKIPQDDPNRYIATVTIKGKLTDEFDESFRINVRLNPLFNKSSKGSGARMIKQHCGCGEKCDRLYKSLENKMIHIKSIELVENERYGTSAYVYDWEWLE